MPHTKSEEVFYFRELDDSAKEYARNKFRENNLDYEWWENVYEDAAQIADILGIDLRCRRRHFHSGKTDDKGIAIYFSGFSSQGDGACFEGHYTYAKGCAKKIRQHAPQDTELHDIADALVEAQQSANYGLSASMKHSGHYSHSGCMSVEVRRVDKCGDDASLTDNQVSMVTQCMRDFADWIYTSLEKEYDWLQADEQIDERLSDEVYEFTKEGRTV